MKIKFRQGINTEELELMIQRYFEGLTTVDEEQQLHKLLSQPSLKGRYDAERAMLGYFKQQKKRTFSIPFMQKVAVIAILIVSGMFAVQFLTTDVQASYAYVHGIKTTDISMVRSKALASLESLPSTAALVDQQLKDINNKKLIESQLEIFAEFE